MAFLIGRYLPTNGQACRRPVRAASPEADTLIDAALAARLWYDTLQPWTLRPSIVALCDLKAADSIACPPVGHASMTSVMPAVGFKKLS
jgi:hypothetical protein